MSDQDYRRDTAMAVETTPEAAAPSAAEFGSNSMNADNVRDEAAKQSVDKEFKEFWTAYLAYEDDGRLADVIEGADMVEAAARGQQPHRLGKEVVNYIWEKMDKTWDALREVRESLGPFAITDKGKVQKSMDALAAQKEYYSDFTH